MFYFINI